jgi:hypothetical protein
MIYIYGVVLFACGLKATEFSFHIYGVHLRNLVRILEISKKTVLVLRITNLLEKLRNRVWA